MRRLLPLLLFSALALTTARAQSVHWENSDSGDPADLQLIFQDCAPESDVRLPVIPGVTLAQTGTSTQMSIVNFSMTKSVIINFNARSQHPASAVSIPSFTVQTNKGAIRVPAFTGGAARQASDANVNAHLTPGSTSLWVGEVFSLTYVLDVARRNFNQLGTNIDWSPAPLVVEEWSKPEPSEIVVNGEAHLNILYRARGYTKSHGAISLNSASQLVNLQTGSVGFGLFQAPRVEQVSVHTDPVLLSVRALPSPAPAGFKDAVGQFKFTSKVVPASAGVGEPITWTLELSGTGNWPDIAGLPQRDVSKDFQVIQPQAKRTPTDGKLFDVTLSEDVVLIPTHTGTYTLGPMAFTYFDPKSGSYKTITTAPTTVTITPPPNSPLTGNQTSSASNAGDNSSQSRSDTPKTKLQNSEPPVGIPRDPLSGAELVPTPLPRRSLAALVLSPIAVLLLFWAWLAMRRAQTTDPLRPQREARARLDATLAKLPTARGADRAALLLAWQHDSTVLWQISHAAPPASALTDSAWNRLWAEADRALYGITPATLPTDWTVRAEAALAAKPVRAFAPLRLFLPRNLLPFFFALVVAALLPSNTRAADPSAAYRSGDFPAAEEVWRETLATHPTDTIARHNLSLALAQQDRWGEAAAHAAAAFVQNPFAEPIRWQLALACEKAGFVPGPLAGFLPAGPAQSLARLASPVLWQFALGAASLLFCLGCGLLLVGSYSRGARWRRWFAGLALGGGLLLASAAVVSLRAYGETADRRAVIVWREGVLRSIPTEADTTQKTSTLAPGSMALADKTFLGWVRLNFENGQTGWVRKEDLVSLWK